VSVANADADAKRRVAVAIGAVARQVTRRFNLSVEKIGLTSAKWKLIAVVSRMPGVTQRTIAETLDVTEASAGRLIDRLCADGHLRRIANPHDRRAYRVYLTEAADPLLAQLEAIGRLHETEAFAGFSGEELAQLKDLLTRVLDNLAMTSPNAAAHENHRESEKA
jgi:MarR family transcriptional regulator for hemolysin